MRLSWAVLAVGLFGSTAAMADGLECQANILYGDNTTVLDAATGTSVTIVPEPYLPTTGIYGSYDFNLGGSGYVAPPAPYVPPAQPYVPPAEPYVPPVVPYTPPPAPPAQPGTSTFLDGTMWRLQSVNGRPVVATATLNFGGDGRFDGRAACNAYNGQVGVFDDFAIDFAVGLVTRAACAQLDEEQAFFAALDAATDFRPGREGDTLALLDATGATVATFLRDGDVPGQAGASIVGMWTVAGVLIDGVLETDSGFGAPSFTFMEGGEFTANLGCNSAFGTYTQSGSSLTFGTVGITARACLVPAPFEGPISQHLRNIRMVQAIGGGLSLRDANGVELIRLTR